MPGLAPVAYWAANAWTPAPPSPLGQYARTFDGTDDRISFNAGALTSALPKTMAAVIRRTASGSYDGIVTITKSDGGFGFNFYLAPDGSLELWDTSGGQGSVQTTLVVPLNTWCLVVGRKTSGSSAASFSLYRFDTKAWSHANGSVATFGAFTVGRGLLGASTETGNDPFAGQIAGAGVWNSVLTQTEVENLANVDYASAAEWKANTPVPAALWSLHQSATTTAVPDEIGTSAQFAITGTAIYNSAGTVPWEPIAAPTDTTPPTPNIVSVSRSKISRIPGRDTIDIVWESNEAFTEYQIRIVSSDNATVTMGTLVESGVMSGTAGTDYTSVVTDDELFAAAAVEGSNKLKVFIKDTAGNWSTA